MNDIYILTGDHWDEYDSDSQVVTEIIGVFTDQQLAIKEFNDRCESHLTVIPKDIWEENQDKCMIYDEEKGEYKFTAIETHNFTEEDWEYAYNYYSWFINTHIKLLKVQQVNTTPFSFDVVNEFKNYD